MEKQPQPVFRKTGGNCQKMKGKRCIRNHHARKTGGVIIWLSIFCVIFRILSFTLYRIFGGKDTKFLNDKAMNDDEKR